MRIGKCVECGKELKNGEYMKIWDFQDEKEVKLCNICYDYGVREGDIEI